MSTKVKGKKDGKGICIVMPDDVWEDLDSLHWEMKMSKTSAIIQALREFLQRFKTAKLSK